MSSLGYVKDRKISCLCHFFIGPIFEIFQFFISIHIKRKRPEIKTMILVVTGKTHERNDMIWAVPSLIHGPAHTTNSTFFSFPVFQVILADGSPLGWIHIRGGEN